MVHLDQFTLFGSSPLPARKEKVPVEPVYQKVQLFASNKNNGLIWMMNTRLGNSENII